MRQKTSPWFEIKFCYDKTSDNGVTKKTTETYVVEALSFTEAEKKICDEMMDYVSGEYCVKAISIARYKEVWFSDVDTDDKWFKAKLQFITINETTNKEKKTNIFYLVQAGNMDKAKKYIDDEMSQTIMDYKIISIKETGIMDVFEQETK